MKGWVVSYIFVALWQRVSVTSTWNVYSICSYCTNGDIEEAEIFKYDCYKNK